MVKYEDPRPSTTRTRALNKRLNKMISPTSTQSPGWRHHRPTKSVPPGGRLCRPAGGFVARREALPPDGRHCCPALGAHIFHFTLEETWIIKKDLDPLK
uniref:Uncharacterized protein n=1 Tax=Tanacetum cinerariifolium TaxID=118510 RepID=A0A699J9N0_TANCI|nr:hypothetical protein [Tanacetum cinerariifolium]